MEKLITNPTPKCNRKEFFQLYDRIIINVNDIEAFLVMTETQKRIEYAKRILDAMLLDTNFPPASCLISEIAEFEATVRYNRTVRNHSRDHYIHICYLYLLGIYVFFYYPDCNLKLSNSLALIRTSTETSETNNFVKSFISAWKYFILFHDIAYEFEYLGNSKMQYNDLEKKEKERIEECFKPEKIYREIIDMLVTKAMATLLAIQYTIQKTTSKTNGLVNYLNKYKDMFLDVDSGENIEDVLKEVNNTELTFLHYIHTGDDLKYFLTLFENNDFIVAFKRDLKIECFIYKGKLYKARGLKKDKYIKKIQKNREMVFDDETYLRFQNISIEYYGVNIKDKYDSFIRIINLLPTELKQYNLDAKNINRMKELVLFFYLECKKIRAIEVDEKKCLEEFKDYVRKSMTNIIEKEILINHGEKKYFNKASRSEFEEKYVMKYCKVIADKFSSISEEQIEKIALGGEESSRKKYIDSNIIKSVYEEGEKSINCIDEKSIVSSKNVWEYYSNKQYKNTKKLFERNIMEYMERSLREATGSELKLFDILKSYKLSYSEYDHGITAAIVYLLHFHYYQNIIDFSIDNKWLHMCFNIPNKTTAAKQKDYVMTKYKEDYQNISSQVAYAILIHNLYPNCFGNDIKKMLTNDTDTPFAYFCMLCDALQNWGRPYNIDPILEEEPLFIDAKKYNISLGEFIKVTFDESRLWVMEKELNDFKNVLGEYLSAADAKIKVSFK